MKKTFATALPDCSGAFLAASESETRFLAMEATPSSLTGIMLGLALGHGQRQILRRPCSL